MLKHRGFPGRLAGTDFQFTLRRESKSGATPLKARKRHPDRKPADRRADAAFLEALLENFGDAPFERGNLDAGRLSWLLGREVVAAEDPFDPASYEALLKIDLKAVQANFSNVLAGFDIIEDDPVEGWDATDEEDPA